MEQNSCRPRIEACVSSILNTSWPSEEPPRSWMMWGEMGCPGQAPPWHLRRFASSDRYLPFFRKCLFGSTCGTKGNSETTALISSESSSSSSSSSVGCCGRSILRIVLPSISVWPSSGGRSRWSRSMSPERVEGMSTSRTHWPNQVPSWIQNSSIQRPSMNLRNWPSTCLPLGGDRLLLSRICSYSARRASTFSPNTMLGGGCVVIIPVIPEEFDFLLIQAVQRRMLSYMDCTLEGGWLKDRAYR